jgi:hypothetical protein
VSEPPKKTVRRRRRPTLASALRAARAAGEKVQRAVVEDGKIVLEFGEPGDGTNDTDWDRKLTELERGKH